MHYVYNKVYFASKNKNKYQKQNNQQNNLQNISIKIGLLKGFWWDVIIIWQINTK